MRLIKYDQEARRALDILARANPECSALELANIVACALGIAIGDMTYPVSPSQLIIAYGDMIAVGARHAQVQQTEMQRAGCAGAA